MACPPLTSTGIWELFGWDEPGGSDCELISWGGPWGAGLAPGGTLVTTPPWFGKVPPPLWNKYKINKLGLVF